MKWRSLVGMAALGLTCLGLRADIAFSTGATDRAPFDTRGLGTDADLDATVHLGGVLAADETWAAGTVHVVYGTITVPTNVVLTIAPGAIVKFVGGGIVANGAVVAKGVTFTDIDDDSFGGDTRRNGDVRTYPSYALAGDIEADDATHVVCAHNDDAVFTLGETSVFAFNTRGLMDTDDLTGANVHIGGVLTADETWAAGTVHVVYGTITVPTGVTLTIEPGAIVKFVGGGIVANGAVVAKGVTCTDIDDDSFGGDTRRNGDVRTYPSYVLAGTIETDDDTRLVCPKNCNRHYTVGNAAAVRLMVGDNCHRLAHESEPITFSTDWEDSSRVEVVVTTPRGETTVLTNVVAACSGVISWEPPKQAGLYAFRHVCDTNVLEASIYVVNGAVVHEGRLTGTNVWDTSIVHLINGTVKVPYGAKLTIEAGAVVKAMPGAKLVVEDGGVCMAGGAVFTHAEDDSLGGDLFCDGAAPEIPENDYWVLGYIDDNATTEYRYAQRSVSGKVAADSVWEANRVYVIDGVLTVAEGVSLTIPSGTIVKFTDESKLVVEEGGLCMAEGAVFTHVADDTAGGDTMGDGGATTPKYGKYTIAGNVVDSDDTEYRYSAPIVLSGTISDNTTWRARGVYRITGNLTIARGATLTILPGAVVKMGLGVSLRVNEGGALEARGTHASPIVFTSIKDDEWGGDTNGDGDATGAELGDWASIYVGGNVSMSHVRIRYGGKNGSSPSDVFYLSGGSVSFDNSLLEHSFEYCVGLENGSWSMSNSVFDDFYTAFRHFASCTCVNSVFYNFSYLSNNGGQTFKNCVISHFSKALCWWTDNCTYRNCLIYNAPGFGPQSSEKVGQNGNVWGDPLFEDPDHGNFRVATDSPCVDAGDSSVAPSKDFSGQPRVGAAADIGIYEVMPRYVASDVDLRMKEVNVTGTGVVGEELVVSWVVENGGTAPVYDSWRDKVEIVSARGDKIELGEKLIKTGLSAGGVRTYSSRWKLPVLASGAYTIQVTANYARDVFEGTLTENNMGSSASFAVAVPSVEAASGATMTIRGEEEGVLHFTIDPASSDRLITIIASDGMYALFGTSGVPTESYNVGKVSASDGTICFVVPENATDVYIRLVNGSKDDTECVVAFSAARVRILDVSPRTVPYDGKVTLRVEGAGLDRVKDIAFKAADATLVLCSGWRADSSGQIVLSADGTLLKPGAEYRLTLIDGDDEETDSDQRLTVTEEPARSEVWAKMKVPDVVRAGRQYLCTIEYGNKGNADAVAPIFQVSVLGSGQLKLLADEMLQKNLLFVGAGASDNAGVLVPGETKKIEFLYAAGTESDTLTLSIGEDVELAAAAGRLALRGEDATDYFCAQELAEKIVAGEPCGVCHGYVRDADGYPVGDYYVTVTNGEVEVSAVTDSNGHYVTEACGDDDERVDGVVSNVSTYAYIEVLGGSDDTCVTAVDCVSGVTVLGERGNDGHYRFRGIPDGVYRVIVQEGELVADGMIVVSDLSFYPLRLTLSAPGLIQGTFTGDGTEREPAVMLVGNGFRRLAEVSADGAFVFAGLSAGTYAVAYAGEAFTDYSATNELVIAGGETAFCDIVKTNNLSVSTVAAKMISTPKIRLCTANAVQASASGPVTRDNIEKYAYMLSTHAPSPPPSDRNCSHNKRRYQSAMKMYRYMNSTLNRASYVKSELEQVERELRMQWWKAAELLCSAGLTHALAIVKLSKEAKLAATLVPATIDGIGSVVDILVGEVIEKIDAVVSPASLFADLASSKTAIFEFVRTLDLECLERQIAELGSDSYMLSKKIEWAKDDLALLTKLGKLMDCLGTFVGVLQAVKLGSDRTRLLNQKDQLQAELGVLLDGINRDIASVLQSPDYPLCCPKGGNTLVTTPPVQTNVLEEVESKDPNEVAGPIGFGDPNTERFVRPGEWMTYTVYFENSSNATAGAQEVFVTNPLSEWLDWESFEMGEVVFANQTDVGLSGLQVGKCETDLAGTAYRVQSNVSIDKKKGVVDWYLRLVDPSTASGWPEDPYAGFLQPNDESHCGEGHLTYRVKVREDAPNHVVIDNAALIVFDYNEAIATDPSWWNTVGSPLIVAETGETDYEPEGWTRPIVVSNDWLIAKGLVEPGDSVTEAQTKLSETGANGLKRYESYLLGMEPDSEVPAEEQLKVTIEGFDNEGLPIIGYTPKPNDASRVKYTTLGKSELKAVDWVEVTDLNKYLMRFYRIKAEIVP